MLDTGHLETIYACRTDHQPPPSAIEAATFMTIASMLQLTLVQCLAFQNLSLRRLEQLGGKSNVLGPAPLHHKDIVGVVHHANLRQLS